MESIGIDVPIIRLLPILAVATVVSGCEQWKAPERVRELEGRVNELSAAVSAMKGEPVGAGSGAPAGSTPGDHAAANLAPPSSAASAKAAEPASTAEHPPAGDAEPAAAPAPAHAVPPAGGHTQPHWGYEGPEGPPAWGKLSADWAACGEGKAQSPIDIEPKAGQASPIAFHYGPTAATVVDNGHTLQVNLAPGSSIDIDGRAYQLVQFHVHTPSEHSIAGEHYPMELHLVHRDATGKLAVVGVMYDAGAESKALDPIWSKWPRKTGVQEKLRKPFDPNGLLPETRTAYRYPGSLTTPPCSEGVIWNVLRRTMSDSKTNLDILRVHYPNNARPVLPRGDRKVL